MNTKTLEQILIDEIAFDCNNKELEEWKKDNPGLWEAIISAMKEASILHSKAALKEASEQAKIVKAFQYSRPIFGSVYKERIDKDSILNAYPEEKII